MPREHHQRAAERFQMALSLYELAEEMVRQNFRRKHPEASSEEVEEAVYSWQLRRPGAEFGDADGQPSSWPRQTEVCNSSLER